MCVLRFFSAVFLYAVATLIERSKGETQSRGAVASGLAPQAAK
jgi:hypothetical protein